LLVRKNLYLCKACRYQASLTAGTILHKTKTPLWKWFWLIYHLGTSKTGVSLAEMQRELEIKDYKTIWGIVHHRAILRDPKDSMKLLPWTHRLIANAKAVISGPHRGVSENIFIGT